MSYITSGNRSLIKEKTLKTTITCSCNSKFSYKIIKKHITKWIDDKSINNEKLCSSSINPVKQFKDFLDGT